LEESQYGLLLLDEHLDVVWMSNAGAASLRYEVDEIVGRRAGEFLDPDQSPEVLEAVGEVLRASAAGIEPGWQLGVRVRLFCGDGVSRDFEFGGWAVEGEAPREMMLVFLDVSERSRLEDVLTAITEHDLESALRRFLNLASSQLRAPTGIALHPSLGGTTYASPGARPSLFDDLSPSDSGPCVKPIESPPGTIVAWLVVDREDMSPWAQETANRLGSLLGLVLSHHATVVDLVDAAATDPLTGLANRRVLQFALLAAQADPSPGWAALYCDLDRFKLVNDRWGHDAGDGVLRTVGARLSRAVRSADVIARVGGDEFVILVQADKALAERLVERVRESVARPIAQGLGTFQVDISIGVACATTAEGVRDLVSRADEAMRRDKAARRPGPDAGR
jgi:diguanylate cyclase (GGDEF)-like protein